MSTSSRKHLWKSALRQTGCEPACVGYWLLRHRRAERLRPVELARKLGLALEGLVLLSLCRTPREDHFREDLEVVCRRTGADATALAQVLRQQQALARWAEKARPPGQALATGGWLIAASDALPPEEEGPESPPPGDPHAS